MPYYYRKNGQESDFDALYRELGKNGVPAANLKQGFLSDSRIFYHKLDTHWNNSGAVLAHNMIMDVFGKKAVDFESVPSRIVKDFTGNSYHMLYPDGNMKDTDVSYQYSFNFKYEEFAHCRFTKAVPYNLSLMEKDRFGYIMIEIAERHLRQLQEGIPVMEAEELDYFPEYECDNQNRVTLGMEERNELGLVKLYGYVDMDFTDSLSNIYVQIVNDGGVHIYEAFPAVNDVKMNPDRNDYGYGIYVPQSVCNSTNTKIMVITERGGDVLFKKTV